MARMTPSNMFATPKDMDAMMDYVEKFNGGERAAATVAMGMTWNLACKYEKDTEGLLTAAYTWLEFFNEYVKDHEQMTALDAELQDMRDLMKVIREEYITKEEAQ